MIAYSIQEDAIGCRKSRVSKVLGTYSARGVGLRLEGCPTISHRLCVWPVARFSVYMKVGSQGRMDTLSVHIAG